MKYPRKNFFLAVGMARAIRYSVLAYLGSMYSRQIFHFFRVYRRPILWTSVEVIVIGCLAALFWISRRKSQRKPVIPDAEDGRSRAA